jgi:hypothetical protein
MANEISTENSATCPKCGAFIKLDCLECRHCGALFSDPQGWKPIDGSTTNTIVAPGGFYVFKLCLGLGLLIATVWEIVAYWFDDSKASSLFGSHIWMLFRFNPSRIVLISLAASVVWTLYFSKLKMPADYWHAGLLSWAFAPLALYTLCVLAVGPILVTVLAPYLLPPSLVLFLFATTLVISKIVRVKSQ